MAVLAGVPTLLLFIAPLAGGGGGGGYITVVHSSIGGWWVTRMCRSWQSFAGDSNVSFMAVLVGQPQCVIHGSTGG